MTPARRDFAIVLVAAVAGAAAGVTAATGLDIRPAAAAFVGVATLLVVALALDPERRRRGGRRRSRQ